MGKKLEYTECLDFVSNRLYQKDFNNLNGNETYHVKCETTIEMGRRVKLKETPSGSVQIKSMIGLQKVLKQIGASKIIIENSDRIKVDGSHIYVTFYQKNAIVLNGFVIPIHETNTYEYIKMILLIVAYNDEEIEREFLRLYPREEV